MRQTKMFYYLQVADAVSERSTCLRRRYGAVIVNNDEIVSTGYNGAPRGCTNCCDIGECIRNKLDVAHGSDYNACRSVHAEMNAIISAGRDRCIGSTLYLSGRDGETGKIVDSIYLCEICKRLVINAGIKTVICATPNHSEIPDCIGMPIIIDVQNDLVKHEDVAPKYCK